MILTKKEIDTLVRLANVIDDYDPSWEEHGPTKIDLRLGNRCYLSSDPKNIIRLPDDGPVKIQPNDIFMYQTHEKIKIPYYIIGKTLLKMRHAAKGLLMGNATQVEPGYHSYLFGMLYNLSDEEIILNYKDPIVSLEFHKIKQIDRIPSRLGMANTTFEEFCGKRAQSTLSRMSNELKSQRENIKSQAENMKLQADRTESDIRTTNRQITRSGNLLTFVTITVGVIAVSLALATVFTAARPNLDIKLLERIESREEAISDLRERLTKLELLSESADLPKPWAIESKIDNQIIDSQ